METIWRRASAFLLIAVVALLGAGCDKNALSASDGVRAEVVRVIDGDTLVAEVGGEEATIRLLNIDTPETKDPNQPVQCLGPEASEYLADRLPPGTRIELQFDEERTDRYGRVLAGVFESNSLVNAEIAAAGLGLPVYFAPNKRFLPEVEAASAEARAEQVGLFDAEAGCTLESQLQEIAETVNEVPEHVDGDPTAALTDAGSVVDDVAAFLAALTPEGLPELGNEIFAATTLSNYLTDYQAEATAELERAEERRTALEELKATYDEEQLRLEEARKERERLEREEQERKEREEREERERQEEERRERQRREESRPTSSKSQKSSGNSGGSTSSGKTSGGGSSGGGSSSGSGCVPYGPEIPYSSDGGYTGKRHGMPGGKTFRKCN